MIEYKTYLFLFKDFIYLSVRDRKRGRDTGSGKSRLPPGTPTWDWIPGPQDHALSQRQTLNHWATRASPKFIFLFYFIFLKDFIYLFMGDRERQRHRQREKQLPCREPDTRLHPGTPGSRPGWAEGGAKPLSHQAAQSMWLLMSELQVWAPHWAERLLKNKTLKINKTLETSF